MMLKVENPNNLPLAKVADLIPTQGELKDLTKENYAKLKASFDKHGFIFPIAVWEHDGKYHLIDGHQRKRVLDKEQPDIQVPIIKIPAKSLKEAAEILLKVSSQYGTITQEGIDAYIATYKLAEVEIYESVKFDALPLLGKSEEEAEQDDVPELSTEPAISILGAVYQLGKHRLMCADATDGEAVNILLDGVIPSLMVTDPPYGVNYDPKWRDDVDMQVGTRSLGTVNNDDRSDWTEAYELFGGDVAYIWHASLLTGNVQQQLNSIGFDTVASIIWVKLHFQFSRGDYHWQHEPCWYVVRHGKKHNYVGDRKQSTIWQIANNNPFGNSDQEEKTGHSTQKPVEVMARPIRNNSSPGQAVYDPFGGSGSTLIAAEQLDVSVI